MLTKQVKWITPNLRDTSRRIARVGGDDFDHSISEVIMNLHMRRYRYWIDVKGKRIWLELATRIGPIYVKAETDDYEPEALLSLPYRLLE